LFFFTFSRQTNEYIEPYLSPLVLRKELENIANNDGLIIDKNFLEKRSHIFWNLVRTVINNHFKNLNSFSLALVFQTYSSRF
jgi:hypothetical protein